MDAGARMGTQARRGARIAPGIVAAALVATFLGLGAGIAALKSNTFDEAYHISSGFAYLEHGIDHFGAKNHPVLGRAIAAALPWALLDLDFDAAVAPDFVPGSDYLPYAGRFLYENTAPGGRVLLLARLANLLLGALLGVFVHRWARDEWGDAAAATALFVYALSPVMLANASLATTDLPIAAFSTMTCYFLSRLARTGRLGRDALAAGVFLGLSLAVKYTAVLLLPLLLAACVWRSRRDGAVRGAAAFVLAGAAAYAVVWTAYGWRYGSSGPTFNGFPWERFTDLAAEPFVRALRAVHALPESYLYGVLGSLSDAGSGKPAFLMGEHSMSGWPHYFLVAFLIKTPVAALLLLGAALARVLARPTERATAFWLLAPALLLASFVSTQRINIGIRHILPVFPLLCVLSGAAAPALTRARWPARALFGSLLLWQLYAAVSVYPHQLAYFNEIAGGPKNGYRWLVDSNLDWGQDLKGLKRYMDRAGIARIKLAYFGFADPHWFGIDYEHLPSVTILNPVPAEPHVELSGWFAISATLLQGVYLPHPDLYAEFRGRRPEAVIGHSIFVYRL